MNNREELSEKSNPEKKGKGLESILRAEKAKREIIIINKKSQMKEQCFLKCVQLFLKLQ